MSCHQPLPEDEEKTAGSANGGGNASNSRDLDPAGLKQEQDAKDGSSNSSDSDSGHPTEHLDQQQQEELRQQLQHHISDHGHHSPPRNDHVSDNHPTDISSISEAHEKIISAGYQYQPVTSSNDHHHHHHHSLQPHSGHSSESITIWSTSGDNFSHHGPMTYTLAGRIGSFTLPLIRWEIMMSANFMMPS